MEFIHYPVLHKEIIDNLDINPEGIYCDCTLGGGGHTRLILDKLSDKGLVIGIDRDESAISNAEQTIKDSRLITVKDNFANIESVLEQLGHEQIDGVIMDLGVSSHQLDTPERGFSYIRDSRLDMRMDNSQSKTAHDIINKYPEADLTRIFFTYGEERYSRQIARRIISAREDKEITTTLELVAIIESAVPAQSKRRGGHPAKRVFQAIRIEVNDELGILEGAVTKAVASLKKEGRIAIITFHSLEDRIIKTTFANLADPCTCPSFFPHCICGNNPVIRLINKKVIKPSEQEISENSRSAGAKLRVAEKIV